MNRPKAIGTRAESAVVHHLRSIGLAAERTAPHGAQDVGDIWVEGGKIVIEVKARNRQPSARDIDGWLDELAAEAGRVPQCEAALLIVKPPNLGAARVGRWPVWTWCDDWLWLCQVPDPPRAWRVHPVGSRLDSAANLLRIHPQVGGQL